MICNPAEESKKVLTCFEAIIQLPNGSRGVNQYYKKCDLKTVTFKEFILKNHWEFDKEILPYLKIKFNVVQFNYKNEAILIYDNRFYKTVKPHWPEICWILDKNESFLNICINTRIRQSR